MYLDCSILLFFSFLVLAISLASFIGLIGIPRPDFDLTLASFIEEAISDYCGLEVRSLDIEKL